MRWQLWRIGALVLTPMIVVAACVPMGGPMPGPGFGARGVVRQFASNGERIYFTATSTSGNPITYDWVAGGGMMEMRLACADCHGPQGEGGRVRLMMRTFDAPNIMWPELTEQHGEHGENAHPPYTAMTVRRAITEGRNPAGEPLDALMPRWRISERDLDDLIAYLTTLR